MSFGRYDMPEGSCYPYGINVGVVTQAVTGIPIERFLCIRFGLKKVEERFDYYSKRKCPHRKELLFFVAFCGWRPRWNFGFIWVPS